MKIVPQITLQAAAAKIAEDDTLIVGGFGMTGNPTNLLHAIAETDVKGLTYIANNIGEPGLGGGRLLRNGQIKKAIGSFFSSNPEVVKAAQNKEIDLELLPQGNLCEAIRAGGAGLGGFFSPSSAGTSIAEGRETRVIDGKEMVFVSPLYGNVALIRAWKADAAGNLQYRMTENNFNQSAATAADLVIVEVEEIVQVGELDPNCIHTPGCFVDYLVQAKLQLEDLGSSAKVVLKATQADGFRMNIARAALDELHSGEIVNVVNIIITELAVFQFSEKGLSLVRVMPGSSLDEIAEKTTAQYYIALRPQNASK